MIKRIIIAVSLLFAVNAYAALDLELTQGLSKALPIGIVNFSGQPDSTSADNIATVLSNDLGHSGRFNVMRDSNTTGQVDNAGNIDFAKWRKQNANDVVVGDVKQLANGQYQVSFQLVNVYTATSNPNNTATALTNATLLSQSFTVPKTELRQLAHHISDLIFQKLTGIRGIFTTRIAYVAVQMRAGRPYRYALEVADMDGYNPKPLLVSPEPIMSPTWSPNGKEVAYVSFEGGNAAIYLQNVRTGQRRIVTDYAGVNGAPAFSPDGKQLALVLTKTGYPKIFIVDIASGKLTQLTNGYAIDTEPSWAPDGKSIIFTSNRGGGPQVYQINLATHQVQRLTYNGDYNARASFTPNGQDIVVLHRDSRGYNIAIQNLATGNMQILTKNGHDQSPSVAPNGQMIVYATRYQGRGVLAMVSSDDKVLLRMPARDGDVREPVWSPFTRG